METFLLTFLNNPTNASGDTMLKSAVTKVPSIAMRILQQGISALQLKLSTQSFRILILTLLGMLAGRYLAKKFANRSAILRIIHHLLSASPLPSLFPKVPKHPILGGLEDELIAPGPQKMESNDVALQQSQGRHGPGGSQLTNGSSRAPNPKAAATATNNPDIHEHWGHKDKEQNEKSSGPYYNTVHSATDRAVQMVTSVNHGSIYNGCSVIQAGLVVICALAAVLVFILINKD